MIRVYVAGPIRLGDRPANIRNAIRAGEELRQAGFYPYVPHANELWAIVCPVEEEDWLEQDMAWLSVCDGVLRLPGASEGSDRETEFARTLGLPVFDSIQEVIEWATRRG